MHLVIHNEPGVLLELAAEPLLRPQPASGAFPSPGCLLVLRQGGLRDDLYRLAAERNVPGWFDPPLCVFNELPQRLGATSLVPLGDFERIALITRILRDLGGPTFQHRAGSFARAIAQFFGELRAEAVSPERLVAGVPVEGREPFQEQRDRDLAQSYAAYVQELERNHRRDGRDTLADCAVALSASPEHLKARLAGRREIRILGLSDLRGGWRMLLQALKASPAVDRIILYATNELSTLHGLADSVERVDRTTRSPAVRVLAEPDSDRELDGVASRVRDLLEGGTAPARIAIVPRQARPYTDRIIRSLVRAGIPAVTRRRIRWREVPCIRALLALLEAAAENWSRHGLAELGSQPYFSAEIDVRVVNFIGFRERVAGLAGWSAAFERLRAEARAAAALPDGEEEERKRRSLPMEWVEQAAERFELFTQIAAELETARPLDAWIAWWSDWLARDPWQMERRMVRIPEDRWEVARVDLMGWRGLGDLLKEWLDAERQWPGDTEPLTAREFLFRFCAMLDGDLALWTGPAQGVQVLEAQAASHRTFDHVFLVGMNAGRFPRRAPSSLLLGEEDREQLAAVGLPLETSVQWDDRERELFRVLVAGAARTLTLSYTTLDETGADAIPSAFVDELASGESAKPAAWRPIPFPGNEALLRHAHRTATIERVRATGALSPWNGAVEEPALQAWLAEEFGEARVWSPTQIEEFAKCPWAWFSRRLLRLELREDPDEGVDPKARGMVLHDALRRFYGAAAERAGGPVFLLPEDIAWAAALLREELAAALTAAGPVVWLGHPSLRQVKHAELERMLLEYLAFEMEENRKAYDGRTKAGKMIRTAVAEHEVKFEKILLERDGIRFQFRGIMDRIEVGVDERAPGDWVATVDYKTTKYACPGAGKREAWDDGVVLQVPLYAWALQVLRPGARVARVEYRAIKSAERVHPLSLVQIGKAGLSEGREEQTRIEGALRAAARHVGRVRAGEFPAAPAPSCNCPPFCHAWDVCRVKAGPRTGRE